MHCCDIWVENHQRHAPQLLLLASSAGIVEQVKGGVVLSVG